ncbi:MAG: hypothetical protein IKG81_13840 [Bacteroidales bacterium]|nr:hypothetical protein [Bacteroidales bacterium]
MKHLILVIITLGLSFAAMAQQPATNSDTTGHEKQEMPTGKIAVPQKAEQSSPITVLAPETMVLKAGEENEVRIKIEKVGVNNMILKVVNEDACDMRKGSELGTYYMTPKVKEGTVTVRVGYMDFMGAYFKLADLEFEIE